jgi:hypothetical protein
MVILYPLKAKGLLLRSNVLLWASPAQRSTGDGVLRDEAETSLVSLR